MPPFVCYRCGSFIEPWETRERDNEGRTWHTLRSTCAERRAQRLREEVRLKRLRDEDRATRL